MRGKGTLNFMVIGSNWPPIFLNSQGLFLPFFGFHCPEVLFCLFVASVLKAQLSLCVLC